MFRWSFRGLMSSNDDGLAGYSRKCWDTAVQNTSPNWRKLIRKRSVKDGLTWTTN